MRGRTYQDDLDFAVLLAELASGACTFLSSRELTRWDAPGMWCDPVEVVALLVKAWVPGRDAGLCVRVPVTELNCRDLEVLGCGDLVAFTGPYERAYLDYPEDGPFTATEQHVLYALGVEKREA